MEDDQATTDMPNSSNTSREVMPLSPSAPIPDLCDAPIPCLMNISSHADGVTSGTHSSHITNKYPSASAPPISIESTLGDFVWPKAIADQGLTPHHTDRDINRVARRAHEDRVRQWEMNGNRGPAPQLVLPYPPMDRRKRALRVETLPDPPARLMSVGCAPEDIPPQMEECPPAFTPPHETGTRRRHSRVASQIPKRVWRLCPQSSVRHPRRRAR